MRTIPLLMMLTGCLRPSPAHVAPDATPLRLVTALGSYEEGVVQELPDPVVERVREELALRRLTPEPVGLFAEAFGVRRAAAQRLEVLEEAGVAEPLLLVACDPRFDTQVNGRYRWQVHCDVALAAPTAEGGDVMGEVDTSAHLVYYHQQEAEAVTDAAALLAREVGRVLDAWLAAREAPLGG